MKKLMLIVLILALCACAQTWTPKCSQDAIYVMATVGREHETRAVYGYLYGGYHVEVEALIDDRWEYVTLKYGKIEGVDNIEGFVPTAYETPEEYFNSTLRWMRQGRKGRQ